MLARQSDVEQIEANETFKLTLNDTNKYGDKDSIIAIDDEKEEQSENTCLSLSPYKEEMKVTINTSLYALRGCVIASHYVGYGFMMSSLGESTAAASSITTTVSMFMMGASSGFLNTGGIELSEALGKGKKDHASDIIKASVGLTVLLGGFTSITFLSSKYILGHILEKPTADSAGDFFQAFALATIPELLIYTYGQVIFKIENNSYMPLLSTMLYRGASLGASYGMGITLGYGAWGIGIGGGIAGWASLVVLQPWFSRSVYHEFNLYDLRINNLKENLKTLSSGGWKLLLQRITEWANLAIITQTIGAWNNKNLLAAQPSVLMLTFCNLFSQGFSHAAMMMAKEDRTKLQEYFNSFEDTNDQQWMVKANEMLARNKKNIYIGNFVGLGINVALASGLYLSRATLIHWYVPQNATKSTKTLAEDLLFINAVSLIPDVIRVITGGMLLGWSDLMIPTIASLILMTGAGIPIGAWVGYEMAKSVIPFFMARMIFLTLSALVNGIRLAMHLQDDEIECEQLKSMSLLIDNLNLIDISNQIMQEAQMETLRETLDHFGLQLPDSNDKCGNLFDVLYMVLDGNYSRDVIKHQLARQVKNHFNIYEKFFKGHRRESRINEIGANHPEWADELIALAAAHAFEINLIVIESNNLQPNIIYSENAMNTFYIAHQSGGEYYLLTGEPNNELIKLFDDVRHEYESQKKKENGSSLGNWYSLYYCQNKKEDETIDQTDDLVSNFEL